MYVILILLELQKDDIFILQVTFSEKNIILMRKI